MTNRDGQDNYYKMRTRKRWAFSDPPDGQNGKEGEGMKRVCITYKMQRPGEKAETVAVLPMTDERAESILKLGEDSIYVSPSCQASVYRTLAAMAQIQGYDYAGFCRAELA